MPPTSGTTTGAEVVPVMANGIPPPEPPAPLFERALPPVSAPKRAANSFGRAAGEAGDCAHSSSKAAGKIRDHFQIQLAGSADRSLSGDGSDGRQHQIQRIEIRAGRIVANVCAQRLNFGVVAAATAAQAGERTERAEF